MKKILVTGGGGYIGSVATYMLLRRGYEVVVIDNFDTGYEEPLIKLKKEFKSKFNYYKADLRYNLTPVFQKEKKIEAVIHYAASCLVNESMENPQKYFFNNVCGTQNLLSTLLTQNINKIIFSSTCAVYGEAKYIPLDEKHPTSPTNPYGESKLMIENIIQWYGKLKDLKYLIFRYFNVCGASDDGEIGDSKHPSSLLVQNAVRGALGIEPFFLTCPLVNTKDKTPIRDYINVVDLNEAHIIGLEYIFSGGESGIFNLGTETGNSVMEIIKEVKKLTGKEFRMKKGEVRKGEYAKTVADITKARNILKWKPERAIEDSISTLISWYKKHPQGWKK